MRKIFLLIIVSFFSIAITAQELGFIGGPSLNHGTIIALDDKASFKPIPGGGFHAGLLFEMNITNRWGFDVAAMYQLRTMRWNLGYATTDTTTTFKRQLGYLNIPVHLFVDFPVQNKYVVSLFGGPVFTCGLHGNDWAWENTEMRRPVTYEKENMFSEEGRVVRCEIAAELGVAFKINNWQARMSYQYSFNNGTKNRYLYTLPMERNTPTYFTQGELKLSVAYLFDLRK